MMDLSHSKGQAALEIVRILQGAGHDALFAGGCVRDYLLGSAPTDYDIATSANPDQVEKLFKKTIPVGRQFGVILVLLDGFQFEVATFRTEGGYQDGRRPGFIHFSNAKEDASRRDFTVNGLFYDPLQKKVLDYVEGEKDLKNQVLRCIGDPALRFDEDKLRLLRAIRFAARLGFKIDAATWVEIKKRATQIGVVSKERVRDELDKILTGPNVVMGLEGLVDSGLWNALIPQVVPSSATALFLSLKSPSLALANAALFVSLPLSESLKIMRDLRYSNDVIQKTQNRIEIEKKLENFNLLRKGEFAILCHESDYPDALSLYQARVQANQVSFAYLANIQQSQKEWDAKPFPLPFLSGQDLTQLGVKPGPQLGSYLKEAYLKQLEGDFTQKAQALEWVELQIKKGSSNA